jgi:hypothetical protein
MEEGPVTRGPWEAPGFRTVLGRAISWVLGA